jgi:nicotinate-nucleotide adenylyltransferase
MQLGIFGGTFDPPHFGHLILAAEARFQLRLDRSLFVLTPDPPHKQDRDITPLEDRLAMLAAAISGEPAFELSRVEIDRPGPHYALDTMQELAKMHPNDELVYLIGGDSLKNLPSWRRPQEFLAACHALGVMRRPGDDIDLGELEAELPGIKNKVRFIDAPLLEIASSELRQRIQAGEPFRYYMPLTVYKTIQERGIYRRD